MKCKACIKVIDNAATICPYCRTEYTAEEKEINTQEKDLGHAWVWLFLFGCVYLAIKNKWGFALIFLVLAVMSSGLSWFVAAFFTRRIMNAPDYITGA